METLHFELDGAPIETHYETEQSLLDILRDRLGVMTAKNGCGTGGCGACTVLLGGKIRRACTLKPAKLEGKAVTTAAGLPEPQRSMVSACLVAAGAVQCGFCTPGMVVAGVALLLRDGAPDEAAVRKALRGNICRCTGYGRIVVGLLEAARRLRDGEAVPAMPAADGVGRPACREGDQRRALGAQPYVDDVRLPGLLFGAVVLASAPRARVLDMDASVALEMRGVVRVIGADDVPGERHQGMIHRDWPMYVAVGEITRCVGDVLALVVGQTRAQARAGAAAVVVRVEELEPVTTAAAALAAGAPQLHAGGNLLSNPVLARGDLAAARAATVHTAADRFTVPPIEHAFLEPESALAVPASHDGPWPTPFPADAGGCLTVLSGTQGVFADRRQIASALALPEDQVRIVLVPPGGGFGGKEDLSVQHHAALAAFLCDSPVNVTLDREESIRTHPKRHGMLVDAEIGCDRAGNLTYCQALITADTGAYASLGGEVVERATVHATGPYRFQAVQLEGRTVYTNNPPAGAMRGFGVPQVAFAIEALLDRLADACGSDPLAMRLHNGLRPGWPFATGQILEGDVRFLQTLEAVRDVYEGARAAGKAVGIAAAIKNVGIGVGVPDFGRVRIEVRGGRVIVYSGAACMGQGIEQVLRNVTCDAVGCPPADVDVVLGDTAITPDAGVTTASRQTFLTGTACRMAAQELAEAAASAGSLDAMEGREFAAEYGPTTHAITDPEPDPRSHVAFGFATQVAILGDDGKVERLVTAVDVGQVVNPLGVLGQIEGGTAMGLGYALSEDLTGEGGWPSTTNYAKLGLPRATDMPVMEIRVLPPVDVHGPSGSSLGAKGVGEVSAIPTAPAVAAAHRKRTGRALNSLPLKL